MRFFFSCLSHVVKKKMHAIQGALKMWYFSQPPLMEYTFSGVMLEGIQVQEISSWNRLMFLYMMK